MAMQPSERAELREELEGTIGPRGTELLMSQLPTEEVVTKSYLDEALDRFATKEDVAELREDFATFRGEMKEEFAVFRGDVRVEMRDLMQQQTRTFIFAMVGTIAALAATMFTAGAVS